MRQLQLTPEQILPQAYEEAREIGKIVRANCFGHTYEYANLGLNDAYSGLVRALIEDYNAYFYLGRNFDGMIFVFRDNLQSNVSLDQIALHEHFEGRGIQDHHLSHILACRDELRLLAKYDQEQYKNLAECMVWLNKWADGKKRFEEEGLYYYFGNEISDLDELIRVAKMSPIEILEYYQDVLEKKYRHFEVFCDCGLSENKISQ